MFQNLLWVDTLARVQTHYLIKEVDEFCIADPFVSLEVESFLEDGHKVAEAVTEKLILFVHDLGVVTTSHAEQPHVDSAMAVEG